MGMLAWIYKSPLGGNCSNNGISQTNQQVCIVNVDGPFEPSDDCPAVKLIKRDRVGNVVCVPVDLLTRGAWTMFGGSLIYTSDSRFSDAVAKLADYDFGFPVALHDRCEG
jgi:hypothetical protein